MKILVTGSAGFIGYHTTLRLLKEGCEVVGLDNLNCYYDIKIKYARLRNLGINKAIRDEKIKSDIYFDHKFIYTDLENKEILEKLFEEEKFDKVINLAAQAGVRYSLTHPHDYISSNIIGFMNILECCRYNNVKHLIYASSSSVYGLNKDLPFCTRENVDKPISIYAATKKANELMAHTYSYLYGLSTTGLRFFTVYGPWGRPDMALFIFTKAILEGEPIDIYNNGEMKRDFTYIDDIVNGIMKVLPNNITSDNPIPYRVYNIGNNSPVRLMDFVREIEKNLGIRAIMNFLPLQPGDVPSTWADIEDLIYDTDYFPTIGVVDGIKNFIEWYLDYYKDSV